MQAYYHITLMFCQWQMIYAQTYDGFRITTKTHVLRTKLSKNHLKDLNIKKTAGIMPYGNNKLVYTINISVKKSKQKY